MTTGPDARPVVVAFDGSAESHEAVRTAGTLFHDRLVLVVTVWEPGLAMASAMVPSPEVGGAGYIPPPPEEVEMVDRAQRHHAVATADAGVQIAIDAGARAEAVPVPDDLNIAETMVSIAEERDAAALVVCSRGLGRVKAAQLGSTTRRLLHETRRPVLVVRTPPQA
jgi:nucleotide-binding universal stress UspA family protein